jgi:hypothetical protein
MLIRLKQAYGRAVHSEEDTAVISIPDAESLVDITAIFINGKAVFPFLNLIDFGFHNYKRFIEVGRWCDYEHDLYQYNC